jgi:PDZ domain-containing protein
MSPADSLRWQQDLFLESQQNAAVAAARAAGYRASVTGSGAEVVAVVPSSPAASALRPDDVVVAVDGVRVQTATDFRASVEGRPAGQQMRLTVERGDRRLRVTLANARLPQVLGGTGLGVLADTRDLEAVLPFEVSFRPRPDVGGPSAGLAYALALTDMLDPGSDASGRTIAATGTISPDGAVGAVGGVHEKALAARGAGADVFLVPSRELGAVDTPELDTVGVSSLGRAVQVLQGSAQ